MTTAEEIKAIRGRTGLSQAAFAVRWSIPRRTLEDWDAGRRTPPPYLLPLLAHAVATANPE